MPGATMYSPGCLTEQTAAYPAELSLHYVICDLRGKRIVAALFGQPLKTDPERKRFSPGSNSQIAWGFNSDCKSMDCQQQIKVTLRFKRQKNTVVVPTMLKM